MIEALSKRLFILGPRSEFAQTLTANLERLGIKCELAFENSLEHLRALAKNNPPEEVLLLSSLAPGWSFDLLNSMVILFPSSHFFVVGKGFFLNDCACESMGVHCFFEHTSAVEILAKSIADCRQHLLEEQTPHVS